jgi:2-amino-4-hydroxy-6-hydroxymethyldihydropteridine diphosphokinase
MQNKTKNQKNTILVAMGGNLASKIGPPHVTLGYALASLRLMTNSLLQKSKYFVTPCFPIGYGPDYVNAAVSFQFPGESHERLAILHSIEANFGRRRTQRWGGRVLDLDLLAFGDEIAPTVEVYDAWRDKPLSEQVSQTPQELILPHPRMQDRAFVLGPLMDVAPDWRHPVSGHTVRQMFNRLPAEDRAALKALP